MDEEAPKKAKGGRKRFRAFVWFVTRGRLPWNEGSPEDSAIVHAGYAVRGINGCEFGLTTEQAKARAEQLRGSRSFARMAAILGTPAKERLARMIDMAMTTAEDGMLAAKPDGTPMWSIRQQALQSAIQLGIACRGKRVLENDELSEEDHRMLERAKNRGKTQEVSQFAGKLKSLPEKTGGES